MEEYENLRMVFYEKTYKNRGWYTEGFEPAGYKKYTYSDQQRVVQTVYAGSHLYMYAAWDEYQIYYDANGAKINMLGIKPAITARNDGEYINSIEAYDNDDMYDSDDYDKPTFNGYYLYRADVDLWYYEKPDGTKKWLKEGSEEANESTKYLRTCNSSGVGYLKGTAPIGETLILVAQWS